jgi:small subunit ribosomal protein S6
MNHYELALVVSAKIDDAARAAVVEKAKGYVTRYGGEILGVEEWGKKRLAYEIRHERDGYYFFVAFDAAPDAPAQIESHVRIMDNVLRYLIVRRDENGEEMFENPTEAPAAEAAPKAAEAPAETAETPAEEAPAEEAADDNTEAKEEN